MLVEKRVSVEFFEKIKGDVRLVLFASLADDGEIALKADRIHLMAHGPQCSDDVIFSSPGLRFFLDAFRDGFWRHQLMRQQYQDSEFRFWFESHNGIR